MIKVDLLIPRYSGKGGTETVIKKVVDFFEKREDITFHLVLSQGMDSLTWLGTFQNYEENKNPSSNKLVQYASGVLYLSKYFKRTDADIIICLNTTMLRVAHFFKNRYKKSFKLVSWIHFSIFDEKAIDSKFLHLAEYHLAISSGIKKQLQSLNIPDEQIFLLFNPIEHQERTISPPNQGKKYIYIGRLMMEGQKNVSELLYGLAQLDGDWSLDIYGDGEERQELESLASKLGIVDKVAFLGWVVNPWNQIQSATALVLTSQFEGFPMVLLESISYGVPCISSNCPTGPEDIITEANGLLYKMHKTEELCQSLSVIGEKTFSSEEVKQSINRFYPETYFTVFAQFLYKIIS